MTQTRQIAARPVPKGQGSQAGQGDRGNNQGRNQDEGRGGNQSQGRQTEGPNK